MLLDKRNQLSLQKVDLIFFVTKIFFIIITLGLFIHFNNAI